MAQRPKVTTCRSVYIRSWIRFLIVDRVVEPAIEAPQQTPSPSGLSLNYQFAHMAQTLAARNANQSFLCLYAYMNSELINTRP